MNKEAILNSGSHDANMGRMSESGAGMANTTMPKSTNSESHGGKRDIASTEGHSMSPESHGKKSSNSMKA